MNEIIKELNEINRMNNLPNKRQKSTTNRIKKSDDDEFKVPIKSVVNNKKRKNNGLINEVFQKKNKLKEEEDDDEDEELCLTKYSPKCKADICIDKRKLGVIESWFKSIYEDKELDNRVLVLFGPTGCCKTSTIKVLANYYEVKLSEFEEKTQTFVKESEEEFSDEKKLTEQIGKQLIQLERFATDINSVMSKKERDQRKAILIKDLPSTFLSKPTSLHEFLISYLKLFRKKAPIIFIITINDEMTTNQLKKLFPTELTKELSLHFIELNGVIKKQIRIVLERININGLVCKKDLDYLVESSNGDIRSAINAIDFLVNSNNKDQFEIQNYKNESISLMLTKDFSHSFFHMLGKIMYCKRDGDEQTKKATTKSTTSSKLIVNSNFEFSNNNNDNNNFKISKEEERRKLKECPEEIMNLIDSSGETLSIFIYDSYLDFVDEDFTNATNIISNLCFIDSSFSNSWDCTELDDYMKLLAIRGTMFNLNTKELPNSKKRQFKSFTRPKLYSIKNEEDKFKSKIEDLHKQDENKFRTKEELLEILSFKDKNLFMRKLSY